MAKYDWHERSIVTEAKINAYFSSTLITMRNLIAEAEVSEQAEVLAIVGVAVTGVAVITSNNIGNRNLIRSVAAELLTTDNSAVENNEFNELCHTIEIADVNELRDLHTEELPLCDE